VTGLAELARLVAGDLWGDLDPETRSFLRDAPRTWQEADRRELDDFAAERTRDYVARPRVTDPILAHVQSAAGAPWGLCLTGEPGSGKSSLFGDVYQTLRERDDLLVLANAAGISVSSGQVDRLLRRWVHKLAAVLRIENPLADLDQQPAEPGERGPGQTVTRSVSERGRGEQTGPQKSVSERIVAGLAEEGHPRLAWILSLLDEPALAAEERAAICDRYHFELLDALENDAPLGTRLAVVKRTNETLQQLCRQDPGNAGWQRDLWVSYWRMAAMTEQMGRGDAQPWWRKAYDVLWGMKQRGLFVSAQDEQFLAQLRAKIGG
jgi:hypothetical protein